MKTNDTSLLDLINKLLFLIHIGLIIHIKKESFVFVFMTIDFALLKRRIVVNLAFFVLKTKVDFIWLKITLNFEAKKLTQRFSKKNKFSAQKHR